MTAARIEQEISRPYVIRAQTRKPVGDGNEVLHNRIVTAHAGSYEQAAEQVGQQVALGGEHVAKLLTPKSIFEGDLGSLYPDGGRHTRLGGSAILSAVADLLDAYDAKDADRIRDRRHRFLQSRFHPEPIGEEIKPYRADADQIVNWPRRGRNSRGMIQ